MFPTQNLDITEKHQEENIIVNPLMSGHADFILAASYSRGNEWSKCSTSSKSAVIPNGLVSEAAAVWGSLYVWRAQEMVSTSHLFPFFPVAPSRYCNLDHSSSLYSSFYCKISKLQVQLKKVGVALLPLLHLETLPRSPLWAPVSLQPRV